MQTKYNLESKIRTTDRIGPIRTMYKFHMIWIISVSYFNWKINAHEKQSIRSGLKVYDPGWKLTILNESIRSYCKNVRSLIRKYIILGYRTTETIPPSGHPNIRIMLRSFVFSQRIVYFSQMIKMILGLFTFSFDNNRLRSTF